MLDVKSNDIPAVAHLHHFIEHIRGGRTIWDAALIGGTTFDRLVTLRILLMMMIGFQLMYTTLFGAYATFIFMRTGLLPFPDPLSFSAYCVSIGHLLSVFLVHMFCNIMGFPDVSLFDPNHSLHSFRISKLSWQRLYRFYDTQSWSIVLLGAYLLGIYGFSRVVIPWTEPDIYASQLWNVTIAADRNILNQTDIKSNDL